MAQAAPPTRLLRPRRSALPSPPAPAAPAAPGHPATAAAQQGGPARRTGVGVELGISRWQAWPCLSYCICSSLQIQCNCSCRYHEEFSRKRDRAAVRPRSALRHTAQARHCASLGTRPACGAARPAPPTWSAGTCSSPSSWRICACTPSEHASGSGGCSRSVHASGGGAAASAAAHTSPSCCAWSWYSSPTAWVSSQRATPRRSAGGTGHSRSARYLASAPCQAPGSVDCSCLRPSMGYCLILVFSSHTSSARNWAGSPTSQPSGLG